jgi:hypothetical protein
VLVQLYRAYYSIEGSFSTFYYLILVVLGAFSLYYIKGTLEVYQAQQVG